jgi:hypothetical protein
VKTQKLCREQGRGATAAATPSMQGCVTISMYLSLR